MDSLEVTTDVYRSPAHVFEFLLDFTGYARYSKYLRDVRRDGDGGPGTDYELVFSWWKLEYTAHSRVTAVDHPHRIDWTLVTDLDASGSWRIEPLDPSKLEDRGHGDGSNGNQGSRVTFHVEYDPDSVDAGVVDVPLIVSIGWIVDRVKPLIRGEAERIVERVVADLEGDRREVDLKIRTNRDP